jgi:hypothetical protein
MRLALAGDISAGPLGLLVVVLIAVATVLLIRNMNARLKRMPRSFDEPPPDDERAPGDGRRLPPT